MRTISKFIERGNVCLTYAKDGKMIHGGAVSIFDDQGNKISLSPFDLWALRSFVDECWEADKKWCDEDIKAEEEDRKREEERREYTKQFYSQPVKASKWWQW